MHAYWRADTRRSTSPMRRFMRLQIPNMRFRSCEP